jgi:hypothetical protein
MGLNNTFCELANGSADAFIPRNPRLPHEAAPGGRIIGLTAQKAAGTNITLKWFPSCSTADVDYDINEGTIGTWYSHLPVACTTAGATTATFAPAAGNDYYLVVPKGATTEGSYGANSASVPRPVSTAACVPQALGTCP